MAFPIFSKFVEAFSIAFVARHFGPCFLRAMGANMTAGFKPCPWLIPEDMPRRRLQPLAGRINLMELGGVEPPVAQPPDGKRQRQASPASIEKPASWEILSSRFAGFFFVYSTCYKLYNKIVIHCQAVAD